MRRKWQDSGFWLIFMGIWWELVENCMGNSPIYGESTGNWNLGNAGNCENPSDLRWFKLNCHKWCVQDRTSQVLKRIPAAWEIVIILWDINPFSRVPDKGYIYLEHRSIVICCYILLYIVIHVILLYQDLSSCLQVIYRHGAQRAWISVAARQQCCPLDTAPGMVIGKSKQSTPK
jgi:hypothetical protein